MRSIKHILTRVIKPVAKKYNYSIQLIMNWEEIVGQQFASFCKPLKVSRQQGSSGIGFVVIAVNPGHALLVAHGKDIIIEKINTYLGYDAVAEVKIVQKPVTFVSGSNYQVSNSNSIPIVKADDPKTRLDDALQELKKLIAKDHAK